MLHLLQLSRSQVQILDLVPRPNPEGESYGTTTAYAIGWWNRVGYSTPGYLPTRNAAIVYKVYTCMAALSCFALSSCALIQERYHTFSFCTFKRK